MTKLSTLLSLVFCTLLFLGCSSDKNEQPASPIPIAEPVAPNIQHFTENEENRGIEACEAYVTRVCACSEKHQEFKEECDLARTLPGALKFQIRASKAEGNINRRDKVAILASGRKTIANCIEKEVQLDDQKCPRPKSLKSSL